MQKKGIRIILLVVVIALAAFNSVYIRKLDEVRASASSVRFNPATYAGTFWDKKLPARLGEAVDIGTLIGMLKRSPGNAFSQYSNALGIGNIRYFLVKGEGEITAVNDNDITVKIHSDSLQPVVKIATEFIFGNAVRDASGLVDINEFENTMDFNNVSAEINRLIREKVLPGLKADAKKGATIKFTGAMELNKEHLRTERISIIPEQVLITG